jgi:hypothetical protein
MLEPVFSQEFKLFILLVGANLISFGLGLLLGKALWKNRRIGRF